MSTGGGIFISYRQIDTNWAAVAIHQNFHRKFPNIPLFMDINDINPGVDFRDAIRERVDRCKVVLAVIGPNWLAVQDSHGRRRLDNEFDWVRIEVARGLERAALGEAHVIPVLIDDTRMPDEASLPDSIKRLSFLKAVTISFEGNARDLDTLTDTVGDLFPESRRNTSALLLPSTTPSNYGEEDVATAIAEALVDVGTDPRTMMIYAKGQTNNGRPVISRIVMQHAVSKLRPEVGHDNDLGVLAARNETASGLFYQGKVTEAEVIFQEILAHRERVQGPEHPDTLTTRHNVASALLAQGKAAEAEAAFRDLLTSRERVEGPEHPGTRATRRLLAQATLEQGNAAQAREALSALFYREDQQPTAKARDMMLRAWLADLDGDRLVANGLLDQADALLTQLAPAHYLRRDLSRYRETRGPDGKGGTMVAAEHSSQS